MLCRVASIETEEEDGYNVRRLIYPGMRSEYFV